MLASLLIQVYTGKAWLAGPIYLPPGFLRDKSASRGGEVLEMLLVCSARDGAGDLQPLCTAALSGAGGGQTIFGGTTKHTFAQRRNPPRFQARVRVGFFPWKINTWTDRWCCCEEEGIVNSPVVCLA